MAAAKNAFATLGVTGEVLEPALKKAFHLMAIETHPDKGGDTVQFQELLAAY